jgi:hypothetical protein
MLNLEKLYLYLNDYINMAITDEIEKQEAKKNEGLIKVNNAIQREKSCIVEIMDTK